MIVFRPLADDSLCAIAEKLLCQLEQRAAGSGYQLHHTPQVGRALAAKARSAYGARELRRAVDEADTRAIQTGMDNLRSTIDMLESLTDADLWPVPTYAELLFL